MNRHGSQRDANEDARFGSAGYESEATFERRGFLKRTPLGLQLGYWGERPIFSDSDGPVLMVAGAGAGKLRDVLGYISCCYRGPMIDLDLKRELSAIGIHNQVRFGKAHYVFDPLRDGAVINPLDILKPDAPSFHSDCKAIAADLVPLSGAANAEYFEQRAQMRLEAVMKWMAHELGGVSFPELYSAFNLVDTDPERWGQILDLMAACPYADVRQEAGDMKRTRESKEFLYVLGEIRKCLAFMSDPALQRALGAEADVSLEALSDPARTVRISLCVSPEHVSVWSPVLRSMFNVTQLYKARHPASRRIVLLVDEAAQLGRFKGLVDAFAYGRGVGLRAFAVFQDIGQIATNYGHHAVSGFFGNAETRVLFGVRDEETARSVSHLLGAQTLEYDDTLAQAGAERARRQAVLSVMEGGDPIRAALDIRHYQEAARHRTKQHRQLMTPDEILYMGDNEMLLFAGNLRPARVNRYPYWTRREMAGQFFPNPYHPPLDRVRLRGRLGEKWARIVREPVPARFAHLPQYRGGQWAYVQGYRP